eukprot:1192861-Prorocentrum_minimum.AAC.4
MRLPSVAVVSASQPNSQCLHLLDAPAKCSRSVSKSAPKSVPSSFGCTRSRATPQVSADVMRMRLRGARRARGVNRPRVCAAPLTSDHPSSCGSSLPRDCACALAAVGTGITSRGLILHVAYVYEASSTSCCVVICGGQYWDQGRPMQSSASRSLFLKSCHRSDLEPCGAGTQPNRGRVREAAPVHSPTGGE